MSPNTAAKDHFDLLVDLKNYLGKALAPYEEFMVRGKTYYLSPSGFLHCRDRGSGEGRGYFCGYFDDEVWNHLKTYLNKDSA
jgi:hypothetical protein